MRILLILMSILLILYILMSLHISQSNFKKRAIPLGEVFERNRALNP
jgi:hypothetical protein